MPWRKNTPFLLFVVVITSISTVIALRAGLNSSNPSEEVLILVDRYGLPLVVLVLGAIWLRPKLDRLIDIVLRTFEKTTTIERKDEEKTRNYSENLPAYIDVAGQITRLLRDYMRDVEADRCYVFQYHNGGHNVAGLDFVKCSNTHEVVARGITPQMGNLQSLPISMFFLWNKRIVDHNFVQCADIQCFADEGDYTSYEILKNQDIKSVYVVGIYDLTNKVPLGFIGVDYCRDYYPMDDEQFERLIDLAGKVSALLCVAEYSQCQMLSHAVKERPRG